MPKVPISEQERNSPYYKYFERELARVPAEKLKMLEENPLTPETALRIQDMNDLFRDGYLPGEFGYTRLKDHTITMANLTTMPGVTVAMFDWWFAWHGLDPMRYKIWDPEDHYYALWRNLAQAKDTRLSIRERYWNNICDVKENIGGDKALKVSLYFSNPADFGFDSQKLADFNGTILCGGGVGFPPPRHVPLLASHG
jgi:plasmid maintenance system antidote protein VapI